MHRLRMAYPLTRSYMDLFLQLFGRRGKLYASALVHLLMFLVASGAVLASAESWHEVFHDTCLQGWFFLAFILIWALGQTRSLKGITWISAVSFVLILIPVLIIIAEIKEVVWVNFLDG